MTIRFGPNPLGGIYFGPQDAIAAAGPTITAVTASGAAPYPGETGVTVSVSNDGTAQGSLTYNGIAVSITAWVQGTYTVTWPDLSTGLNLPFNSNLPLIAQDDGGTPGAPFAVQTIPEPGYQYVLIGARASGLPPTEGLFDDDTLGTGDTYVYGFESPAGGWDFAGLANWYINAVPDGGTFTYRLWDEDLSQWSNEATETFAVGAVIVPGSGMFAGNSTFSADARIAKFASGSFAGASAFSADGAIVRLASGSFAGGSAFDADGRVVSGESGSFAGSSAFSAEGRKLNVYRDTASFAAGSAFAGDGRIGGAVTGSGSFAGGSAFAAAGSAIFLGSGDFQGASTFRGNGIIPSQTIGPIDKPGVISGSPQPGLLSKSPKRGVIGSQGGL